MHIHLFKSLEELAPYAEDWDRLAAEVPFRGWTWLSHWWRCYGLTGDCPNFRVGDCPDFPGTMLAWSAKMGLSPLRSPVLSRTLGKFKPASQLAVPAVFDEDNKLIGLAPWYLDYSLTSGRVLRMLGTGEVCSDYLSLLCHRGMEEPIIEALVDFLLECPDDYSDEGLYWDLMVLDGVDSEDHAVNRLAERLSDNGCTIHRRRRLNCWRIDLPATWEEYLKTLSKRFRLQLRNLEQDYFQQNRTVLHIIDRLDDLSWAMDIFVDMHQRRWQLLGEPGCFASPRFESFFRGVLPELMRQGRLQFYWLELDGRPVAMEYHLTGGGVLYTYQATIEPEAMDLQPGKLLNMAIIRRVIEQGYRAIDFLRGDEPYKAHFRAAPRPNMEVRIAPNRASAKLRHNLWWTAWRMKQWIKKGVGGVGQEELKIGDRG